MKLPYELECYVCEMLFQNIHSYMQHFRDKHRSKICTTFCINCVVFFSSKRLFIEHIEELHSENKAEAERILNVSQEASTSLDFNNVLPYKCRLCSATSTSYKTYKQHRKLVHRIGVSQKKCAECGVLCPGHVALKRHMLAHSTKKVPVSTSTTSPSGKTRCPFCDFKSYARYMSNHFAEFHPNEKLPEFTCETCDKKFNSSVSLARHKISAHNNADVLCDFCGKCFGSTNALRAHIKSHNAEPKKRHMECAICKKFVLMPSFLKHMLDHSRDKPHNCIKCDMEFKSSHALKTHIHSIKGGKICCEICTYLACSKAALNSHMQIHVDETGILVCPICDGKELLVSAMVAHIKESHSKSEMDMYCKSITKEFDCPHCKMVFESQDDLENHRIEVKTCSIGTAHAELMCEFCHLKSDDVHSYVAHRKTHPEAFTKKCRFCDTRFKTINGFAIHEFSHKIDAPYRCDICKRAFESPKALHTHKTLVHKEKPFKCRLCPKRFATVADQSTHETTHENKAYVCDVCDKRYKALQDLKAHIQKEHTTINEYSCPYCSFTSHDKNLLDAHQNVHAIYISYS
jgi:KRAB domain-containing zinc finger protein